MHWRWHGPVTVQSSGSPLKVLKRPLTIFLAVTSFRAAAVCSPIRRKFLFLQSFQNQNLTKKCFAAVLSILPLCCCSVSLVSTQTSEPCYESIKVTNIFIYSLSLSPSFRQNRREKVVNKGALRLCGVA